MARENEILRETGDSPNAEKNCKGNKSKHDEDTFESSRCTIDPVLLRLKIFYFLFFAGFGTTFPYLGIYFKQIGLSAGAVGILAGVRPLIQCGGGPLWAMLADKYKARKAILLFSILAWLVMTVLLAFPRPHNEVCKVVNTTSLEKGSKTLAKKKDLIPVIGFHGHMTGILPLPRCFPTCENRRAERSADEIPGRSVIKDDDRIVVKNVFIQNIFNNTKGYNTELQRSAKNSNISKSVQSKTRHNSGAVKRIHEKYVIERNPKEIHDIFVILLILIVVGEFLEAPSFIMTDTALLEYLGEERSLYGRTRLFGSLGYGLASFSIGAILDRFHYQYCGKTMTNYIVLFYIFAGFMTIAFFFALFGVSFSYEKQIDKDEVKSQASILAVLRLFASFRHGSFLLIAWFMGFSHGGIMNFLNWFLEDLGASRFMMGIGSSCRAGAIIVGFMLSNIVIDKLGHYNMILLSLVCYTLSFFGYSVIPNPWYALPIEVAQGICYTMSWSACITYLGAAAPPNSAATVQGVLQGVYWGLGTGIGAFVGGAMINKYGAIKSFRIGGVVTAIVVLFFLFINYTVNREDQVVVQKDIKAKLKDLNETINKE